MEAGNHRKNKAQEKSPMHRRSLMAGVPGALLVALLMLASAGCNVINEPPDPPTGVTAELVEGGVRISWNPVSKADGYYILVTSEPYQESSGEDVFPPQGWDGKTTSFVTETMLDGDNYYWVAAWRAHLTSEAVYAHIRIVGPKTAGEDKAKALCDCFKIANTENAIACRESLDLQYDEFKNKEGFEQAFWEELNKCNAERPEWW